MMPKGHIEIRVHKIHGYDSRDKIVVPVLHFSDEQDKRVYDREQMQEYLNDVIDALELEEEKNEKKC